MTIHSVSKQEGLAVPRPTSKPVGSPSHMVPTPRRTNRPFKITQLVREKWYFPSSGFGLTYSMTPHSHKHVRGSKRSTRIRICHCQRFKTFWQTFLLFFYWFFLFYFSVPKIFKMMKKIFLTAESWLVEFSLREPSVHICTVRIVFFLFSFCLFFKDWGMDS